MYMYKLSNEVSQFKPLHEETYLQGFRLFKTLTGLFNYREYSEMIIFRQ